MRTPLRTTLGIDVAQYICYVLSSDWFYFSIVQYKLKWFNISMGHRVYCLNIKYIIYINRYYHR